MPRTASILGLALTLAGCGAVDPVGNVIEVSASLSGAYEVSLAALGDELGVGWYDTRDGNAEVYVRLVDPKSGSRGEEYRLTRDPAESYEVDLAALGSGLAMAWYDKDADERLTARVGYWQPNASAFSWQVELGVDGRPSRNPVVRTGADRIFVAWIQENSAGADDVVATWFSADGQSLTPPVTLGVAGETTWNLNAAVRDDGYTAWVVFDALIDTTAEELYLARWSGGRVDLARLTEDDGYASKYPDLEFAGPQVALTWFDERDGNREIYLFVGDAASLSAIDTRAQRVTVGGGESIGAYLASDSSQFGLAWTDETDERFDVYFQAFAFDGGALGPRRRLSKTPARSLIPAIEPWHGGFAIAWNDVTSDAESTHEGATRSAVFVAVVE